MFRPRDGDGGDLMSLPVRGAWIEIPTRASPSLHTSSLPVRGAWIEMGTTIACIFGHNQSLPVRGAWIEIQ